MNMKLELITGNKNEVIFDKDLEKQVPKETRENQEINGNNTEILKPDIRFIENTSRLALFEQNRIMDAKSLTALEITKDSNEDKHGGLTEEEKVRVKEETGWSDEIIDAIGSVEEYEIYKKAGLQEAEINGKKCLIRSDIDLYQKDEDGVTNKQRLERGLPPITKDGRKLELHHIGQKQDSPLAELTTEEHRGVGNDTVLHDKSKESEVDHKKFTTERHKHWKARC